LEAASPAGASLGRESVSKKAGNFLAAGMLRGASERTAEVQHFPDAPRSVPTSRRIQLLWYGL